jgi:pimeloyl-ACP methyl ester carboxylesterase
MTRHSEMIDRDRVSIETYLDGAGGPPVVILPSYGRDGGADFDDFTASLVGAGHQVLRPQPRGIGRSTGPMVNVTLDALADDVAGVIDRLADEPPVVLGHAFGNFVARGLATNHPEKVAAVILAAASGRTVDPEVNSAPFRAGDTSLSEDERLAALRLAFFAPGHDPSIWLHGWYPDTLALQHASVTGIDVAHYWGAGAAPIYELIAEHDPFHQRQEWNDLRDVYGERVTTTVIEGASHALFPEQPAAVADAVIEFLRTVSRPAHPQPARRSARAHRTAATHR